MRYEGDGTAWNGEEVAEPRENLTDVERDRKLNNAAPAIKKLAACGQLVRPPVESRN
jgi:hypothetical protein